METINLNSYNPFECAIVPKGIDFSHENDSYLLGLKNVVESKIHKKQFTGHRVGPVRAMKFYDIAQDDYVTCIDMLIGNEKIHETASIGYRTEKHIGAKLLSVIIRKLRRAAKEFIKKRY